MGSSGETDTTMTAGLGTWNAQGRKGTGWGAVDLTLRRTQGCTTVQDPIGWGSVLYCLSSEPSSTVQGMKLKFTPLVLGNKYS